MADNKNKPATVAQAPAEKPPVKAPLAVMSTDPTEIIDWIEPTLAEAREMDLSRSLANARAEFKPILRNKTGTIGHREYKYADHADVLEAVVDSLAKYEIEVAHTILYKEIGRELWMFIEVSLIKGPDRRSLEWPIGVIDAKNQTNGANLTYAKRYAISAILNLAPDDDTDGQAPDEDRSDRGSRNRDRGYDNRDRRSNFDDRPAENPDAWRESINNETSRGDGDRDDRRDDAPRSKGRTGPNGNGKKNEDPEDKIVAVAIDSLNSSGNKNSAETFWELFKSKTSLKEGDERYNQVRDLYAARWKMHRDEEKRQSDPLGAGDQGKTERKPPAPDVKIDDDHISPDMALGEIETLLENCTSMVEYDALLKKHAHLFDIASQFPPDAELLKDMKEIAVERIEKSDQGQDSRTQRMEDVEDRDRSENGRPDLGDERF